MRILPWILLVPLAAPAVPSPLAGQELEPGDRARVEAPCPEMPTRTCRLSGGIIHAGRDSLILSQPGRNLRFGMGQVERIEVSRGSKGHGILGGVIGFVTVSTIGYIGMNSGGSTALCDRDANQDAMGTGECLALAGVFGLAGGVAGYLIGSLVRSERWEEVSPASISAGWNHSGFQVGARVRF